MKKLIANIKSILKEFKKIRWCRFKEWMISSFTVVLISGIIALLLAGFDIICSYFVSLIGGIF